MIFEVLGERTSHTYRITKNHEYSETSSVHCYIILEQDAPGGTMFERIGDDGVGHLLTADAIPHMPEIGMEIPLADFYQGVESAESAWTVGITVPNTTPVSKSACAAPASAKGNVRSTIARTVPAAPPARSLDP